MSRHLATIALLPWGNALEDLYSPNDSTHTFSSEFRGNYIFGYAEALRRVGVHTVIAWMSTRVDVPIRRTHEPTGATLYLLPSPRLYRAIHHRMALPSGPSMRETSAEVRGARRLLFPLHALAQEMAPYLSTPVSLLAQVLKRERCDAILCQEYEYPRFDICVSVGKWLRLPVFATFQGGKVSHTRLERFLRPKTLENCAGLIIGSQREAERVSARYGISPMRVASILNPVDLPCSEPADRAEARALLGIPPGAHVVAWHGRVAIREKGLDLLVDAWERLLGMRPREILRLILVGTGEDDAQLRLRIANMPSVIRVNHFVHSISELPCYLAAADVYAFPSRYESFPVALVQAMACGLPMVAANTNGVSDILQGGKAAGGIIVPTDDADALTQALDELLDDPSLAVMGRNARERVQTACSLESVGEQLRDFMFPGRFPSSTAASLVFQV